MICSPYNIQCFPFSLYGYKGSISIKTLMAEIEKLEKYKTKLISDVVTGKIDICGIENSEFEYAEEEADEESSVEDEDISEGADGNV